MSIEADARSTSAASAVAPALPPHGRPFAWSVRREIWENRSIWIAPLAAAGFVLLGFSMSLFRLHHTLQKIAMMPAQAQAAVHMIPFGIAAAAVMLTTLIVTVFYCLGTLYNERRDRSILFWKSMPVSDLTTLLAKASVPMIVLPVVGLVVICATQLVMLLLSAAALAAYGQDQALWMQIPLPHIWLLISYGVVAATLWYAPVYAWLLVLSAWAKRAPFLWALLPPLAIGVVEKLALDTNYVFDLVTDRLHVPFSQAFVPLPRHMKVFQWPQPDPAKFFSTPRLWEGLIMAIALFALAVWLRRRREPV